LRCAQLTDLLPFMPAEASYQHHAIQLLESRFALAGCRLARVLNHIDSVLMNETSQS
jgi:hypothetical protein